MHFWKASRATIPGVVQGSGLASMAPGPVAAWSDRCQWGPSRPVITHEATCDWRRRRWRPKRPANRTGIEIGGNNKRSRSMVGNGSNRPTTLLETPHTHTHSSLSKRRFYSVGHGPPVFIFVAQHVGVGWRRRKVG